MFKRGTILAAVFLLMLGTIVPAVAQAQSNWSLYLFDSVSQQLLRIYLDGTQQTYDLGIPEGNYIGQRSLDFSSDGNRVAYCVPINKANGAHAYLYIKDIASTEDPLTVDLGMGDGCWVSYSDDDNHIAAGVVHYYPGMEGVDTSVPPWELIVFDATTGARLHEMNAAKATPAGFPSEPRAYMPDVRYFANNQIIFVPRMWGTEGFPQKPAIFWHLDNDAVEAVEHWWQWGIDSLPATGELVWLEFDSSIAAADPGGPVPQANVVEAAGRSGVANPIYANSDWVLLDTRFIDNGRLLAIHELEPFDPVNDNLGRQQTRWTALDRSGNASELASGIGFSQVSAAPDGYVLLAASDTSTTPVLTLEYHSGRETTPLWQEQSTSGVAWYLVWAAPTLTADNLPAFPIITP